jgi:hypothetical protein
MLGEGFERKLRELVCAGQLGISSLIGFDVVGKGPVALEPGAQRACRCIDPGVGLLAIVW